MQATSSTPADNRKWFALSGLGLGVFMATLDSSIVNISLPTLVEVFRTDFTTVQWVVLSYSLVLTALILSAARLGDMLDKRKIYLTGLVLFALSSLLCGLATNINWLIGARALQGLGATMMQALGMAMVTEAFPAKERGRALGMMGSIVSIGIAVGPPLGGLLIGLVGWRAVFLVNVPVGILTFLAVTRFVASSNPRPNQRFDPAGAVILFVTLTCYAFGMTLGQRVGFGAPLTLGVLGAAALGFTALIAVESRRDQPMIDLSLFRSRLFSLNLLMAFLVFVVLPISFVLPFFLELVKGYPAQQVGLMLMAFPVAMGVVAPVAGWLSDRFGSRVISPIGLVIIIGGCLAMSTLTVEVGLWGFIARMAPVGIGMGMFQSPNNSAIMGSVPKERLGIASGLLVLSRTLGNTTGLPLMAALFSAQALALGGLPAGTDATTAPPLAMAAAVAGTYRIAAGLIVVSAVLAVLAYRVDRRERAQKGAGQPSAVEQGQEV